MPDFAQNWLAEAAQGVWTSALQTAARGFSVDSRQIRPGQLFVALKTHRRDGHDYLSAAADAGATGALVSQAQASIGLPQLVVTDTRVALQRLARAHRDRFQGPVVGITGSCGKTSTKEVLKSLLGPRCHATWANHNNTLGVPLTLLGIDPKQHDCAVIEAGISEPGEMAQLARMINPDCAVLTCIAAAHLEGLGSLEGIARQKALLLLENPKAPCFVPQQALRFEAIQPLAHSAVVLAPAEPVATEAEAAGALSEAAEAYTRTWELEGDAGRGQLQHLITGCQRTGYWRVPVPPLSRGMASNVALALALARHLGVDEQAAAKRLASWAPQGTRGGRFEAGGKTYFVDCYNANPASVRDAVAHFDQQTRGLGTRAFVLAGMKELGANSPQEHARVGQSLPLQPGDWLVLVGEEAKGYAEGLLQEHPGWNQLEGNQLHCASVAADVAALLEHFSGPVLVKGSRAYRLEACLPEALQRTLMQQTPPIC
jgi:UDP-N-acetylmuramoyl-tripeptide--D-alanyl-D-alanine ligase